MEKRKTRFNPMTDTRHKVDGKEYRTRTTFSTSRPAAVQARHVARRIKWFDLDCTEAEYTDTTDAWCLLDEARRLLNQIGRGA